LETFTELKAFVRSPHFLEQRRTALAKLDMGRIDAPIAEIIKAFSRIPHCFTLQSCWGHFLHAHQNDPCNTDPLPVTEEISRVEYRIAYVALCIENSDQGKALFRRLKKIPRLDPEYIQIGCAEWFWERQVNTFVLQVVPFRYRAEDRIWVDYQEALHMEQTRDRFYNRIAKLIEAGA
jgi:hypothetical protein